MRQQKKYDRLRARFGERDIPCDTLHFDIDTLDGYRVFTWNHHWLPRPGGLTC